MIKVAKYQLILWTRDEAGEKLRDYRFLNFNQGKDRHNESSPAAQKKTVHKTLKSFADQIRYYEHEDNAFTRKALVIHALKPPKGVLGSKTLQDKFNQRRGTISPFWLFKSRERQIEMPLMHWINSWSTESDSISLRSEFLCVFASCF